MPPENIFHIQQGDRVMFNSKIVVLIFAVLFIAPVNPALSGVPDASQCEAFIAYTGPGVVSLMVVPDGSGNSFTEARDDQGNIVDATITIIVRDYAGSVIVNYPSEDMWLETADDGLVAGAWANIPDSDTDAQGTTQWVHPLVAGGSSLGPVFVTINAIRLTSNPGLPLKFNSPDINGDLVVNLQDVSILTVDYYSGYSFRCDLNGDGYLNLRDIPIFAEHFGAQRP
jgi:hypothetical protein